MDKANKNIYLGLYPLVLKQLVTILNIFSSIFSMDKGMNSMLKAVYTVLFN